MRLLGAALLAAILLAPAHAALAADTFERDQTPLPAGVTSGTGDQAEPTTSSEIIGSMAVSCVLSDRMSVWLSERLTIPL